MKLFRATICFVLLISLTLALPLPALAVNDGAPALSAKSAILIEAADGDVLYAKNERARMGMASTTKIMTALVVSESLPCDKIISVPKEAVNIEGSSVYLCEGELLSVEQLLSALMLASANDAAVALAVAVSGSVEAFADKMNEKRRRSVCATRILQIRTDFMTNCIIPPPMTSRLSRMPRSKTRLCGASRV